MELTKKIPIMVVISMVGMLLSSCATASGLMNGEEYDRKLYAGVKYYNLELINEALEDGADINRINAMSLSEKNPVRIALNDSRDDVAEYLIKKGADANYSDKYGTSLLMFAALSTDVDFSNLLLEHGAKVDKTDSDGETALEYAVRGYVKRSTEKEINRLMTILIDHGAQIVPKTLESALTGDGIHDNRDMYGLVNRITKSLVENGYDTGLDPLFEAAILGESSKANELIKAGKLKEEYKQEILFYTAAFGSAETLKILEAEGLDLKSRDIGNSSLLYIAAGYGRLEVIEYLLSKGLDIEAQNYDGDTALIKAADNNRYDAVEYLIKEGANVKPYLFHSATKNVLGVAIENGNLDMIKLINASGFPTTDEDMVLSFMDAVYYNHFELAEYFMANGADINGTGNRYTPLWYLSTAGNLEAVQFLIEHGAKVNNGDDALLYAAGDGETEIVEYLIKNGADVNEFIKHTDGKDAGLKGESALMKAIFYGYFDIVKLLVENGADLEYQTESDDKNTAIILASGNGSRNIVEYLLKNGASVNYQNEKGETALMRAISNGWKDNAKILLKYHADVNLKNKDGQTALDIAKEMKNKELIKILKDAE